MSEDSLVLPKGLVRCPVRPGHWIHPETDEVYSLGDVIPEGHADVVDVVDVVDAVDASDSRDASDKSDVPQPPITGESEVKPAAAPTHQLDDGTLVVERVSGSGHKSYAAFNPETGKAGKLVSVKDRDPQPITAVDG